MMTYGVYIYIHIKLNIDDLKFFVLNLSCSFNFFRALFTAHCSFIKVTIGHDFRKILPDDCTYHNGKYLCVCVSQQVKWLEEKAINFIVVNEIPRGRNPR